MSTNRKAEQISFQDIRKVADDSWQKLEEEQSTLLQDPTIPPLSTQYVYVASNQSWLCIAETGSRGFYVEQTPSHCCTSV
jgi:hypothetical protein